MDLQCEEPFARNNQLLMAVKMAVLQTCKYAMLFDFFHRESSSSNLSLSNIVGR